ncbi:NAD-dependent epimerase/dehydratase family protein [Oricola sp.]|uniref:NAD-dependent epimerase/dehydratase family protein n=1 Tax=Oricola sp. TaxID=1979950 RepID=UPI003BA8D9FE
MTALIQPFLVDPIMFDGPVLVTGAGGCLGAWTVAILQASGVPVVAADLREDRYRAELVMGREAAAALTWETSNVTDFRALTQLVEKHDIRAIVHYAGLQVPFCAADPALGARVNVEGTINILQVARDKGIRRTAYASSVAAHGMPPGGQYKATLYGAYKVANEQTAYVYWQDWHVPSVCIRPNVVYGVARDQGISAKFTLALQAVIEGKAYDIPYSGRLSWLHAGEAAAAFIAAVSQEGDGAYVFDLNGGCETVEHGVEILRECAPDAQITVSGAPFPFPPDMDDGPIRAHLDFPSIPVDLGIRSTFDAFVDLHKSGRLRPLT